MPKKLRAWLYASGKSSLFRSALITAVFGILLIAPLKNLSYDVSFRFKPPEPGNEAAFVYINQDTLRLGADAGKLSRTNYARLVDFLSQQNIRLLLMDAIFKESNSPPGADEILAREIGKLRQQCPVILVAGFEDENYPGESLKQSPNPPIPILAAAATSWGHAEVFGNVVRKIPHDYASTPYAGWLAAASLVQKLQGEDQNLERWLHYYGSPDTSAIPGRTLQDAISGNTPPGFFSGKIVVVGQNFSDGKIGAVKDTFSTPYSLFGFAPAPGALIHATAVLNLIRGDWLHLVPMSCQWAAAIAWAFLSVSLLYWLSRKSKTIVVLAALIAGAALCSLSWYVQWHFHWWWSWVGPAFAQTPLALFLVMRNPRSDPYVAFISYRTEEDGAAALLIARSLADRGLKAFIDVESLHAGKFDEQLLGKIESATFLILMLSPNSLARCANADDWVLKEITHALACRKKIIPVLKSGFRFDAKEGVPDLPQIAELKNFHGVVYSNKDFDGFMDQLLALLER